MLNFQIMLNIYAFNLKLQVLLLGILIDHNYKQFHYEYNTVSRPSYLYNDNPHTWKDDLYIQTGPRLVYCEFQFMSPASLLDTTKDVTWDTIKVNGEPFPAMISEAKLPIDMMATIGLYLPWREMNATYEVWARRTAGVCRCHSFYLSKIAN